MFPAITQEILDKHKLIWIGANTAQPADDAHRMGGLRRRRGNEEKFKIDNQRIYVAGLSGGGKIATILGVAFPDVFRGGFYFVGSIATATSPPASPATTGQKLQRPPASS